MTVFQVTQEYGTVSPCFPRTSETNCLGRFGRSISFATLRKPDLRGQFFVGGSGDQQEQTVVKILHRGGLPKSWRSRE